MPKICAHDNPQNWPPRFPCYKHLSNDDKPNLNGHLLMLKEDRLQQGLVASSRGPCRLTRYSRSCRPGRPARFEISGNLEIQKSKILKYLSQGFGQVQNSEIFVARATQNVKILSSFLGDMFQKYGGHFSEEKKKRLRQRRGPSRACRNIIWGSGRAA